MLRIDNQRARCRETEPGSDRGFSKRQRRDPVRSGKSQADLRLGGAGSAPTAISQTRPQSPWLGAALPGEDDRPEPGPGDAADRPLSGLRRGAGLDLPATSLPATLYPRRYRTAGHRRCGPRKLERTRPRGAFCSVSTSTTASRNTSGWPRSPWPTYTTCGSSNTTGNVAYTTPKPGPRR